MRRRHESSIAALVLTICLLPSRLDAQGPVYRERWGYLHLENRRAELLDELVAAAESERLSPAELQTIGQLCAAPDQGVPFVPVARALARVRGVEADDAFVLRATVGAYVLPEVVDPDASNDVGHSANFTVFLPFTLPQPGELAFHLSVRDAAGETIWQQTLTRETSVPDLRMSRPVASMPAGDIADGAYEVTLETIVDAAGPRPHDCVLRWTFHVLRGYQARSEASVLAARKIRGDLDPLPRALLDGLVLQVRRAYGGEAFAVRSDAVRQLEQLETALGNLAADRDVLAGMTGEVATALPAGDIVQPCLLPMSASVADDEPRPLVVFATAAPAYDTSARRPTAPVMREAAWLQRELAGFGSAEGWRVVCLDSPGGGRPYAQALVHALEALPELLPTGGVKPLLVCDREAASVVGLHLAKVAPLTAGVVLVGAGAMPRQVVEQLGDLPVRMVGLEGWPGSAAIDRMLAYVEQRRQAGDSVPDLGLLHARRLPWWFGVALSRDELRDFGKLVLGGG